MPICYNHPPARRSADPGIAWPSNGGDSIDDLGDPFGERIFAAHTSGIDFHRGYDTLDGQDGPGQPADSGGMPVYSPINGCVIRRFYGHFSWFDANNMSQCAEVDPNSKATFSASAGTLTIVGKNDGTVTFPSGIAQLQKVQRFDASVDQNDWAMMFILSATISTTGKVVAGIYDATDSEWFAIEYNGTTFTCKGKDAAGTMTADGTTAAPAACKYGRIRFVQATDTVYWDYSTADPPASESDWTNIASEVVAWTGPLNFKAFIGFDPAAAGADDTIGVRYWGAGDAESINRFGNWIEIADEASKWIMMHFRDFDVSAGAVVRAGQRIGVTGRTGFDVLSGLIIDNHLHTEYIPDNQYSYNNDGPLNPFAATIIPRADTTVSIGVVRDTAFDPNTGLVDCHRLTITVDRDTYNNFQINEFQMVGNLATRTLNWNTRSGLDPADHDANNYNGLYFQSVAFNEASSQYIFKLYASKAVIGSTWTSGYVKDADGNTIWSG